VKTTIVRIAERVARDGDCLLWTGARDKRGYGRIRTDGQLLLVHRAVYEHFFGPIPDGLQIDHLCRNPPCANPAHLEAVTCQENLLRGEGISAVNARKTHCKNGHEFTPENTRIEKRGGRSCRRCDVIRKLAYRERARLRA
jgi:hypothetical protein